MAYHPACLRRLSAVLRHAAMLVPDELRGRIDRAVARQRGRSQIHKGIVLEYEGTIADSSGIDGSLPTLGFH